MGARVVYCYYCYCRIYTYARLRHCTTTTDECTGRQWAPGSCPLQRSAAAVIGRWWRRWWYTRAPPINGTRTTTGHHRRRRRRHLCHTTPATPAAVASRQSRTATGAARTDEIDTRRVNTAAVARDPEASKCIK